MSVESTRAAVVAAFTGVARPEAAEIALHECDECAELRHALAPFEWHAVPRPLLERHASDLPLLSPAAYAYFLPAWLLYALENPSHDAPPTEFLVYNLAPGEASSEDDEAWQRRRLRGLTTEQLAASDAVLALVVAQPEAADYFGAEEVAAGRARYHAAWVERWNS